MQAVWDLFGLVDMAGVTEEQVEAYRNGTADTSRWSRMEDTHTGAVLGGDVDTMAQRAREYSVIRYIHGNMPPFLIMHGDADPMIPLEQSEMLYNSMLSWEGNKADLYVVKGAGHGTPEFFQPAVQKIALDFFCPEYVNREKGERQWNTVSMGRMSSSGWTGARRSWTASGRSAKRNTSFWLRLRDRRDRGSDPGRFRTGKSLIYENGINTGDMEIASCSGNISTMKGKNYLHIHMVVGNVTRDFCCGGHLNRAVISLTGEFVIHKIAGEVDRAYSSEIGLNLYRFVD